ncbi:ASPIC/UnbV domain-containing protein [Leptolyngbya sp. 7M]|uniref:ASPIC/UnbV domain-containing protein n=1 Tax=Leptolyngbya sp. 7M TaxID=2812896 RepID=UPI001B8C9D8B|nr:ASPIC/UnbV domain-containing protein [Leptolyngbya sp. 7M]QYO65424.1 ASPIC/UnbV domain-containing protein [Leptolyngbya sp. 7M]
MKNFLDSARLIPPVTAETERRRDLFQISWRSMQMAERRQSERYAVSFPIRIKWKDDDGNVITEEGLTENVGLNGTLVFLPRRLPSVGSRVNSFGIGGEMEIRTGVHTQKQLISSPRVHFGLGEATATDVLRIIWNNGFVQAEFDLQADQVIAAEQRLKGSCPHLFTWNGERFVMVKDAPPWSPALGLKINAQDIAGVMETEEWFKIPGETVKPKDGAYEFRITGEYWESFYIDHYKLMVIDHPEGTEIFADERFAVPPPPLKVHTTGAARPFAKVFDHNGNDVSETVRAIDEVYLDGIKRGKFQGVAEDHWAEFVLPADAPTDKELMLVADGWLHPTDASINVQLGQSSFTPPKSLSLEVPDGDGWRVVRENLGFPAGKMKTVLVELPPGERRFRLRTNMEIYWDRLVWAEIKDGDENRTTTIELGSAELRYRGFSVIEKANASSPEKPIYDQILTTGQRWRDLEGYYTRFGDVRELLTGVDGRMVLMNAGDELILRFPALPDPPAGYKRDLVFVGNGWIKDGDLNSVFSKTLLPLPRHDSNDYTIPPTRLEDDPVYKRHMSDWLNFHTRYVAPDNFRDRVRRP